ncbi:phospholipase A1-like [Pieris brassicae]|uniref:phospholipase A1-like n=1 Tax=Pieris brassicae TaxID=7116 RepID=UPI001E660BEE|nr:phospholipase A1-like [Pieris brassicae]
MLSEITLEVVKGSIDNYSIFSLDDPTSLLISSCFDTSRPTIVYAFGFTGKVTTPSTLALVNGYIDTKKRNVILLDWEEEAKTGNLGIYLSYTRIAIPNSKWVGEKLGAAILKLYNQGFAIDTLHLIGHSLGAHLMGYAGRWIRTQGVVIPRITGLDPAKPFFEGILATQKGLDYTCATFVDIIHTNPGYYGTTHSVGTVDIWPNYSLFGVQPGCPLGLHPKLSLNDTKASQDSFLQEFSRGNYFLKTNPQSPYHKGLDGLNPHR